jgi:hypothetical protein
MSEFALLKRVFNDQCELRVINDQKAIIKFNEIPTPPDQEISLFWEDELEPQEAFVELKAPKERLANRSNIRRIPTHPTAAIKARDIKLK